MWAHVVLRICPLDRQVLGETTKEMIGTQPPVGLASSFQFQAPATGKRPFGPDDMPKGIW